MELGYLSPSSNLGWRVRYWHFDTEANERSRSDRDVKIGVADDPDIAIDTVSANDNDFLIASASTRIHCFDFEGVSKRYIYHDLVTCSAGIRYAQIKHAYDGMDFDPDTGTFQTRMGTDHKFDGFGPTMSLASRRRVVESDFWLNIEGRGSLLMGEGKGHWDRFNAPGVDPPGVAGDAIDHSNDFRVVSVGELRLGVDYLRETDYGRIEVGTGVEGQVWWNGGTPMNAGQDGATDSDHITSPWSEDLGFIGVYFRGGLTY